MTSLSIQELEEQLSELEQMIGRGGNHPFESLSMRMRIRPEFEKIAKGYLSLATKQNNPDARFRVIEVMEMIRARDIGAHFIRTAPVGPDVRSPWPKNRYSINQQNRDDCYKNYDNGTLRTFYQSAINSPIVSNTHSQSNQVKLEWKNVNGSEILGLTNTIILHLAFVGEDLILACDSNLELFFYGKDAINDRRLRGNSFSDYGYTRERLEPNNIFFGPVVIPNCKNRIYEIAKELHTYVDKTNQSLKPKQWMELFKVLDEIVPYKDIMVSLKIWASERQIMLDEICIVIVPDESLFLLPLSFLGASYGKPLITQVGGISIGLSLLAMKWSASKYHWYTQPNMSKMKAKCALFIPGHIQNYAKLDTICEKLFIHDAFDKGENVVIVDPASRSDFASFYTAGDICWFAGHGTYDVSHYVMVGDEQMLLPVSGPTFNDGTITNWDLITTSNWNFTPLWLMVMNCCVVGRSLYHGPNPLGFVSSLYNAGCISMVAPILPVSDKTANNFARIMSNNIVTNYGSNDFPRAKALSDTIKQAVGQGEDIWDYTPYTLWGLP